MTGGALGRKPWLKTQAWPSVSLCFLSPRKPSLDSTPCSSSPETFSASTSELSSPCSTFIFNLVQPFSLYPLFSPEIQLLFLAPGIEMVMSHFLHTSPLCYRHLFLEPKGQEANLRLSLLSFDSALPCLRRAALLRLCIEPLSHTRHCAGSIHSLNQCLKMLRGNQGANKPAVPSEITSGVEQHELPLVPSLLWDPERREARWQHQKK